MMCSGTMSKQTEVRKMTKERKLLAELLEVAQDLWSDFPAPTTQTQEVMLKRAKDTMLATRRLLNTESA